MKCILLCAGYATRLFPLTENFPKALLEVGGRPLLDYIIDEVNSLNEVDQIYLVTNDRYTPHFQKWAEDKNNIKPIKVFNDKTTNNENRLGAIGDIQYTIEQANINDDLLIIAGDNLFTFKLRDFVDFQKEKGTSAVCVKEEDYETLKRLGVVETDENQKIVGFEEKPAEPKGRYAAYAEYLYPREVNNIISFIGDRGTGKTTVLREFCWLLQNLRSSRKNSWINNMPLDEEAKERLLRTEINFTVLSPIDASLLEEKEDLFELILAGLFEKCEEYWRGGSYTYENRCSETREKLLKKFGEVYRNHRSVKQGDRQEDAGESVVTRLRTMASSKKIQTAFGELIDSFFHLIEGENLNQAVDYLIVVIDDLDLNLEHGFQMLEELQKYLTHPNVIILTALSYKQLSLITESHFIKNLGHSAGGRNTEELALHCRELAKDYLDKLIPVSNRIYMPDIYTKSQDIEIRNDNEKQSIQAKKYIMLKNAEKMHIYYDGLGIKKHFVEKRTVRTLLSSVEFLNSLATVDFSEARMIKGKVPYGVSEKNYENIRKLQRGLVRAYGRNYERYNADIQERMIFEKTDEQQRRFFDDLMGIQLTRRGRYVAALKAENFKSLALNGNALSIPYNYGDLLECIHTWGRKREQDKPLIHCIMASFTSEMVHECICYMYSPDETKRNKSRRKLEHFLGEGFGNDWIGKMLPVRMLEKIEFIAFFRAVEFQMINCYRTQKQTYQYLMHLK